MHARMLINSHIRKQISSQLISPSERSTNRDNTKARMDMRYETGERDSGIIDDEKV